LSSESGHGGVLEGGCRERRVRVRKVTDRFKCSKYVLACGVEGLVLLYC
jgi:hypothetical protein